jgi:hypothetical protein
MTNPISRQKKREEFLHPSLGLEKFTCLKLSKSINLFFEREIFYLLLARLGKPNLNQEGASPFPKAGDK